MTHPNKVIVTGGCGFIGSTLVDRLIETQHHVHVIDDLSAESNDEFYFNNHATHHHKSICSKELDDIFVDADCVFHLAAESRIQPCITNPEKAANTNILGTLNLLNYCRLHKVRRFIYSSTSAVYGMDYELPTNEKAKVTCLNHYSTTKYCGEEMVRLYNRMYGIDCCIFRYFNVFGERSPKKGIYAPVIGIFLNQCKERKPLTIVGNGEQRRDFIHVQDVVEANILAHWHEGKINSEIFNIGANKNYSINEIASFISSNVVHLEPRTGEVRDNMADTSKVQMVLKWQPKIEVENWIKKKLKLFSS
jgi:UDP-glucose 4-epimerase